MSRSILPMLVAVLAATVPGHADLLSADVASDLAAIDARRHACLGKDPGNSGMKQCSGDADAAADAVLNRTYAAAVATLKGKEDDGEDAGETLRRLVASERAWIAYRDAQCTFEGTSMLGGTGEGLVIVECRYATTVARVKAIGAVLDAK